MDDDWPVPKDFADRFPAVRMGEAAIAAWMLDCNCTACDRVRATTEPPKPRDTGRLRALPDPTPKRATTDPNWYARCGHPRTQENSYKIGNSTGCRTCINDASRRRQAAKRAAAREAKLKGSADG